MPCYLLPRVYAVLLFLAVSVPLCAEDQKHGGWRLAQESSPYLQLHAENPVEWYAWGEAAFEKARRDNKPLFISIGYFTCHWCHVMARESFSNPEIAALLNKHFVSIKIDREQRPDLDAAYMRYVMLTRGQGGWPMSVWATPNGEPFLGGTYYPSESKYGQTGFRELLGKLAEVWKDDEKGTRETAALAVAKMRFLNVSAAPLDKLTNTTLVEARRQFADSYDELQGGFGPAPKFPQPARLLFLLRDGEQSSIDMALHTLDNMAAGGINDQLGGGFHRYSTDFEWRVPHFEKMLYDQALVARAYLFAWRNTRNNGYAQTARDILDFSLRELRDKGGGFYSALSADSPGDDSGPGHMEEGAYYIWDWGQFTDALGEGELRDWGAARYGVTETGESKEDVAGKNVLHRVLDNHQLATRFRTDLMTVARNNAEVDKRLLKARSRRPSVPVDDKVVTAWNGYMITTLALAGRLLDEPRYIEAAEAAAGFILGALYDGKSGNLYRDWRKGARGVSGFSDDYAAVAEGLLTLFKVTGKKQWLVQARKITDRMLEKFWDDDVGGFYRTAVDTELWLREKDLADGALVSGNGVGLHVLYGLAEVTDDKDYLERAQQTAAWAGSQLEDAPAAMPYTLMVWPALMADNIAGTAD